VENANGWKTIEGVRCPWKGMESHGRYWIILDLCYQSVCLDDWATVCLMSLISPHCCFTSPFGYMDLTHHDSELLTLAYWLLTDRLLSMTHYAYYTVVEVLISHSKVTGSSPAWLLVFTAEVLEPIAEAPFPFLSSVAYHLSSLEWTLFYTVGAIIQLLVCLIIHIINLCN